jgi:hypothetical protein
MQYSQPMMTTMAQPMMMMQPEMAQQPEMM